MAVKNATLMTEGNIWEKIIKFALPLMFGYLFQQFYTAVDSVVVGNFVSKQALAAVGTTTPIVNMLIGFFTGLSSGASVVIARSFGAQNHKKLEDAVHTAIGMIFALSIVATAIALESISELTACIKEFPWIDTEVISMQVAHDKKAGPYHLMTGQNPIYIFTMQAGENK